MLVRSSRFGEQEVGEDKIIRMPEGMVGFPEEKRFVLLTPPKPGPFLWLQSVDNATLAFVVVEAAGSFPDYQFSLTPEEYAALELDERSEMITLLVVTMAADPYDITVNLQGPIVVNGGRMLARQIILDGASYATRHPFFQGSVKVEVEPGES